MNLLEKSNKKIIKWMKTQLKESFALIIIISMLLLLFSCREDLCSMSKTILNAITIYCVILSICLIGPALLRKLSRLSEKMTSVPLGYWVMTLLIILIQRLLNKGL